MRRMLPSPPPIASGLLVGLTTISSSATTASEIEAAGHHIVLSEDFYEDDAPESPTNRLRALGGVNDNIDVCDDCI